MNQHEVSEVIAEMSATWPQREMTQPEVQMWVAELVPLRATTAIVAVRELRKVCDWMPTHSQFLISYQAVSRREALEQASLPESTAPVTSKDRALAAIAEVRLILNTTTRKKAE